MAEGRFALIVAVSEYEEAQGFKPLSAPLEDARQMAEVLADPKIGGFEVLPLVINQERSAVEAALEHFFCSEERQPEDLLLLYFSGHGLKHIPLGNKLFFAVKNSRKSSPISSAISASALNDMMKSSRAQKQVLLLDCCYSGAFAREFSKKGEAGVNIREHFEEGRGKFILAASGAVEESYEYDRPDKKLSVFTEVLVEGLRSGRADLDQDGEISFEDLWGYAEHEVPARKPGQTPQHQAMEAHKKVLIAHNPAQMHRLSPEIEAMLISTETDVRAFAINKLFGLSQSVGPYTAAARFRLEELRQRQDAGWLAYLAEQNQGLSGTARNKTPEVREVKASKRTAAGIEVFEFGGIEFVKVPKGEFLMGSTQENDLAAENERPQFVMDMPYDYWMGRYPVTNAQYAQFKRKNLNIPKDRANYPVVTVSWKDALAYVEWLNQTYQAGLPEGYHFILPSEAEWEKAARGISGFEWPWGNDFDVSLCNSEEGKKADLSPVGAYSPLGDSPYGCADMAGNVWEWTRSLYQAYPYQPEDGREELVSDELRVVRGGSFFNVYKNARCAYRNRLNMQNKSGNFGFRVSAAPVVKALIKPPEKEHEAIQLTQRSRRTISSKKKEDSFVKRTPAGIEVFEFGGIEFVKVPKGEFLMGSTPKNSLAYDDERPQFSMNIPYDYWMGRYPVTNAQYASFAGKEFKIPEGKTNHPVVHVSWYDAQKFLDGLSQSYLTSLPSGYRFMLPSEAEWEKAARGTAGWEWPWGGAFEASLCNIDESKKGDTTPVGAYSPRGDSPYGCADMIGNAWEWTRSLFQPYPYQSGDGWEDLKSQGTRVLRGGSFRDYREYARCAYRSRNDPNLRLNDYGFRISLVSLY
jgi:formylglycine-generating enzyme required for sulfatase activity